MAPAAGAAVGAPPPTAVVRPVGGDGDDLEEALDRGLLCCPTCGGGRLRRWGWARRRTIRTLEGSVAVRPRRARCEGCGATHVLLPDWLVPRRADSAAVIEAAAAAHATLGYGRVAAELQRPRTTVRDWLRPTNTNPPPCGAQVPPPAAPSDQAQAGERGSSP